MYCPVAHPIKSNMLCLAHLRPFGNREKPQTVMPYRNLFLMSTCHRLVYPQCASGLWRGYSMVAGTELRDKEDCPYGQFRWHCAHDHRKWGYDKSVHITGLWRMTLGMTKQQRGQRLGGWLTAMTKKKWWKSERWRAKPKVKVSETPRSKERTRRKRERACKVQVVAYRILFLIKGYCDTGPGQPEVEAQMMSSERACVNQLGLEGH